MKKSPSPSTRAITAISAAVILVMSTRDASAQTPSKKSASAKSQTVAVEVARVGFVDGGVEMQKPGGPWAAVTEDQPLSSGDRVRTLKGATARLEFPWTAVAVGDESEVSVEKSRLLTLQLHDGRIDIDPEQTLLRIVTAEAAISGSGRTLVRREGTTTFVGSYNGGADVESNGSIVRLGVNKAVLINTGTTPSESMPMGAPPKVLSPSADPRYVRPGEVVHLSWTGRDPSYHLEVLPIDSDVPVVSLDITTREYDLKLNWLGTFRWRVAGRSGPIETQPSGEGLICVVEK